MGSNAIELAAMQAWMKRTLRIDKRKRALMANEYFWIGPAGSDQE